MSHRPGRLLVISGPSGAGKTTVCRVLGEDPGIEVSVSATTRRPRPGEVDGGDYLFLTRAEFNRRRAAGEFIETATYGGNCYGTLRAPVEEALAAGKVVVLVVDTQGARQLRAAGVAGFFIFLRAPVDELRRRLRMRGTNTAAEIDARLRLAVEEMATAPGFYDRVIDSEDLSATVAMVRACCARGVERSAR